MPLLNLDWGGSFHRDQRSFLFQWASVVMDALNKQLPQPEQRFLAEMACYTRLKTTELIQSFEQGPPTVYTPEGRETIERYLSFDPPPPSLVAPARFTDRVEVNVIDSLEGHQVAAAVLFVCPDHKTDSDGALAFAVRVAGLISAGVGVVVVDIVRGPPSWSAHLHSLTGVYPIASRPRATECPVLVVHPLFRDGAEQFAAWHHAAAMGSLLPTIPVPVCGAMHLKLDLEATYSEACERSRIA